MAGENEPGASFALYPWQKECLKAWEKNGRRGIVRAATGAGKTVLALEAIRRVRAGHENVRVKIVVPMIALAQQWQSALLQAAQKEEDDPGFFGAGKRETRDRPVMIYVINSARDRLVRHIRSDLSMGYSVFVIYDECHH